MAFRSKSILAAVLLGVVIIATYQTVPNLVALGDLSTWAQTKSGEAQAWDTQTRLVMAKQERREEGPHLNLSFILGGSDESYRLPDESTPELTEKDFVYSYGYNNAPIVIEEYRLLFFTTPKVSCSLFKSLFRRMMGFDDFWTTKARHESLHVPGSNGLKYLFDYNISAAQEMMTSPNWTRAIFVRDPKERLLSAYLEKAVNRTWASNNCCGKANTTIADKCRRDIQTFPGFVDITRTCPNEHWQAQIKRVDKKFWKFINFVGYFDTIGDDAERMLKVVGDGTAWERFGRTGWGPNGTQAIYGGGTKTHHATGAGNRVSQYYDQRLEEVVEGRYADDYAFFLNL